MLADICRTLMSYNPEAVCKGKTWLRNFSLEIFLLDVTLNAIFFL